MQVSPPRCFPASALTVAPQAVSYSFSRSGAPSSPPHRSALPTLSFPQLRTRWAPSPPLRVLLPLPRTAFLAFTTWLPPTHPSKRSSNRPPLGEAFSAPLPSPSSWVRCRVLCTALTPWLPSIIILNHAIVSLCLPGSLPH